MRYKTPGICIGLVLISCGAKQANPQPTHPKADSTTVRSNPRMTSEEYNRIYALSDNFYNKPLLISGFNGAFLVAKYDSIVYEKYHGYENFHDKSQINEHSAFHLASVSKTFTAMAVLKLMEEGKVNLDSNVTHYIPTFPYSGITVKMLLDHRSGLPNYLNFMTMPLNRRGFRIPWDNKQFLTNDSLLSILIRYKPPISSKPGTRFHYCNTNYAMLALIVESVTGQPFPQYIKQTIFDPLGMKDTYIFSPDRAATAMLSYHRYRRGIAPFPWTPLDGVYGDKNVYCTARDLLIWDKALRHDFLTKATLEMAYSPYSFEKPGIRNYGLGWHMFLYPTEKVIFHNGYWHGNNTVFFRLLKEGYTIIVLGNVYNKNIYHVQPLAEALTGRKFGVKGPVQPDQTDQDDPDAGGQ